MAQAKRETANICSIKDIKEGVFVRTEGWNPSYFTTEKGNISRANIIAVIINKENDKTTVDDGTGQIILRSFETKIPDIEIGELAIIIGRPRIYNEEKYIVPEIIKKIAPEWAEYRKLQLERITIKKDNKTIEKKEPVITKIKESVPEQNPYQKIIEFIKDLDLGEGADSYEVEKRSGLNNAGELINRLIEEGEIFEIRPGKIKLLE
jgi:hypothetical protein